MTPKCRLKVGFFLHNLLQQSCLVIVPEGQIAPHDSEGDHTYCPDIYRLPWANQRQSWQARIMLQEKKAGEKYQNYCASMHVRTTYHMASLARSLEQCMLRDYKNALFWHTQTYYAKSWKHLQNDPNWVSNEQPCGTNAAKPKSAIFITASIPVLESSIFSGFKSL